MSNRVVERIRKLLNLAKQNDSPEEAANAAALAQSLMFRYQIGEEDIDTTDTDQRTPEEIITDGISSGERRRCVWKSNLAHAVATGFGCEMYYTQELTGEFPKKKLETQFKIFGPRTAVQTVHYVYGYLVLEITRLAEEGWTAHKHETRQNGKTWKNSFRLGAVNTIRQRLSEQRETQKIQVEKAKQETPTNNALALYTTDEQRVENAWKQASKQMRLRSAPSARVNYNVSAYQRGSAAGRSIGIGAGKAGISASKARIA